MREHRLVTSRSLLTRFFLWSIVVSNWLRLGALARCINWCNQRGICTAPDDSGTCDCKIGYGNEDCSAKLCPKGFDPLTIDDYPNRRTISLTTGATGGKLSGQLVFWMGPEQVNLPIGISGGECTSLLGRLLTLTEVACTIDTVDEETMSQIITIKIIAFPEVPYENNVYSHTGNPPLSYFKCETQKIDRELSTDPYCDIEDVVNENLPLYTECASHGVCNKLDGVCKCNLGFYGPACTDTTDSKDRHAFTHDGPFFTGSMMRVAAQRTESPEFALFSAHVVPPSSTSIVDKVNHQYDDVSAVTVITGDRKLTHNGQMSVHGTTDLSIPHGSTGSILSLNYGKYVASSGKTDMRIEDSNTASYHLQAVSYNEDVFTVDLNGAISAKALNIGNSSLTADSNGLVGVNNLKIEGALDVVGDVNLGDSLTIGSGFALTPGGMTVDVESHTGTLFELRSRQQEFNGSLFELHTEGSSTSMLKTVANGMTTMELSSSGNMDLNGLRLGSGGIQVETGGISVSAGGIVVKSGGITVETGELDVKEADILARSFKADAPMTTVDGAIIAAASNNEHFLGSILQLKGQNGGDFDFISAVNDQSDVIYSVNGEGDVKTSGVISSKGLVVNGGDTVLGGSIAHTKVSVEANDEIIVPTSCTFLEIVDDGAIKNNTLVFPSVEHRIKVGQLLIIVNKDKQSTRNPDVPSGAGVGFIFDGENWIDIQALTVPSSQINDVRAFTAANDLQIGNVTIEVGKVSLMNYKKSGIVYMGANGALMTNDKITFAKNTLSAPAIRAERLAADLDVHGHKIKNAYITDSKMKNITLLNPDISFSNQKGFAYFTENGHLRAIDSLTMDDDNKVKFDMKTLGLKADALLKVDHHGKLVHAGGLFSATNGSLIVTRTSGHAMEGDLHMQTNYIYDANLRNIASIEATDVSVKTLQVHGLSHQSNDKSQIVTVSKDGDLSSISVDSLFKIPSSYDELSVGSISVHKGANFKGASIREAKLADVEFTGTSKIPSINTEAITIQKQLLIQDIMPGLLSVDKQGIVSGGHAPDFSSINTEKVVVGKTMDVKGDFVLSSHGSDGSNGQLLTVQKNGVVKPSDGKSLKLNAQSMSVDGEFRAGLAEVNKLRFQENVPLTQNGSNVDFLVVSENTGDVRRVSREQLAVYVQTATPQEQHVSFESVHSDAAAFNRFKLPQQALGVKDKAILAVNSDGEVKTLESIPTITVSETAVIKEAQIDSLQLKSDLSSKDGPKSMVVMDSKSGKLGADGAMTIDSQGVINARALKVQSFECDVDMQQHQLSNVHIDKSKITNAEINIKGKGEKGKLAIVDDDDKVVKSNAYIDESGRLHNIALANPTFENINLPSVLDLTSNNLIVKGKSEMHDDLFVDGSVTVRGSVIGSGPYMDSSDPRFKLQIEQYPPVGVLDKVTNLRAKTYRYNTEEFPSRKFPEGRQIGWMADDVEEAFPELVESDVNGFKHVAYARATALFSEALREMREEYQMEIDSLKKRVRQLEDILNPEAVEMSHRGDL